MSTTYPDTQLCPVDIVDAIIIELTRPFPGSPIASGVEDVIYDQRHADGPAAPPKQLCRCGCGATPTPKRRGLNRRCYETAQRNGTLDELYPQMRSVGPRAAPHYCTVPGCHARAYAAHVYCPKHQWRYEQNGNPLARQRGKDEV